MSVCASASGFKCACLCRPVRFFKRAKTEDEGFKLTEHASASECLNYHAIKRISGVVLEVSGNKCPPQR